jgi:hypothetical protein
MIDHQAHTGLFDQRQQAEQLIAFDLDLQKQAELDQLPQKRRARWCGVNIRCG